MQQTWRIWGGVLVMAGLVAAPAVAEHDAVKKAFVSHLKTVGEADTAAMGAHYVDEVTVIRQSMLLKYGGLGGNDGIFKDKKVSKDRLLKAYDEAIEAFGGKKKWKAQYEKLKDQDFEFTTVTEEDLKKGVVKASGIKPGDTMAFVWPKDSVLTVFFRKNEKDKWLIVAESWE